MPTLAPLRSTAPTGACPCPAADLARLGPLLCLYPDCQTHVLAGWAGAVAVRPAVRIDSDGPQESLLFLDAASRPCWQLYLLPDSDYLAWDDVVAQLHAIRSESTATASRTDPKACIQLTVGNPVWRACALRLHAMGETSAPGNLAAANAALSEAGRRAAERIARGIGTRLTSTFS
ncbi:Hemin transport protein [Arenimonas sp.]|uniref:Hemin transport protein n=1 Tax=Arenimonas sp. TaxID=1872635 RepID=UPI0039E62A8F